MVHTIVPTTRSRSMFVINWPLAPTRLNRYRQNCRRDEDIITTIILGRDKILKLFSVRIVATIEVAMT
ncbi:hypothetical protein MLPF_1634 [Mycobacterium lepromatosis]|nr:hypothetical protein MLPF_1634 [Mycobacterium lepromatosis]